MSIESIAGLAPASGAAAPRLAASVAAPAGADEPDFATMLAGLARDGVENLKGAESAATAGLQGKAPLQKVVEAVMSAELSLQTALSVRDKAVAAWQEISRMQI